MTGTATRRRHPAIRHTRTAGTAARIQPPPVDVLGVAVRPYTRTQAVSAVVGLLDAGASATVAFVNAHTANLAHRDGAFREVLAGTDLVLNDGIGVAIAARVNRRRFPDNLNGTDLIPEVLARLAARGASVFLLGARPGVAAAAAARLVQATPGLVIAETTDGYTVGEAEAVAQVRASGADVLLVAMGNPAQELWLHRNLSDTGARIGIGVGGFFDFVSGEAKRAPRWIRDAHLEWLFRLAREPRRLFVRYVLGNPVFLARVLCARVGQLGQQPGQAVGLPADAGGAVSGRVGPAGPRREDGVSHAQTPPGTERCA